MQAANSWISLIGGLLMIGTALCTPVIAFIRWREKTDSRINELERLLKSPEAKP